MLASEVIDILDGILGDFKFVTGEQYLPFITRVRDEIVTLRCPELLRQADGSMIDGLPPLAAVSDDTGLGIGWRQLLVDDTSALIIAEDTKNERSQKQSDLFKGRYERPFKK